jgi:tRNA U55 pseudouridine synthase TruB
MTTFKATANRFTEMFTLLSMGKSGEALFNPVILKVIEEEKGETYIRMLAQDSANTCATAQKHRGFEITDVDKFDIIVNCDEIIEALKIFTPESEVTIEFGERILIKNTEQSDDCNEVSFPSLQLEGISISDQIPFEIKNGMPVLKNKATGKSLKFDVEAKIPVKYIQSQIKSADFANISPRLFEMKFNNKDFELIVGNPDFYEKSVKMDTKIDSSGKANVVFGNGYEQIFSSLTGDAIVFTGTNKPAWITKKDKNYIVQFMLAPAIVESEND